MCRQFHWLSILSTAISLLALALGALDARAQLPAEVMEFPFGVTRQGTPLVAWITASDLDIETSKLRILLVAGLDGSNDTVSAARQVMQQFYSDPRFAGLRDSIALSAILCGNPDGHRAGKLHDNLEGGNPARGYPPKGDYYSSPTNAESQYLWRWIGMHAPDRVIELVPGTKCQFIDTNNRPDDCLIHQLSQSAPAGVGTIEGATRAIAPGDREPFAEPGQHALSALESYAKQSQQARLSPARLELQRRWARSPRAIAEKLAKVYGHDLPTLAYIPAVACIGRLRLARLSGDRLQTSALIEGLAVEYIAGNKPTLPEKHTGSDIAGHVLWGELHADNSVPLYVAFAKAAADRAFDDQGQPLEAMPTHSEMSDAVFMGCPILAQVGSLTDQVKYSDMCLRHMEFMLKLNLRADGLHRHSPLDETAWGRGNGFPALGLCLALEYLPADYHGKAEILKAWKAHLRALLKHQDVTGAWHQVIDHPESYRELTSTCMITYAMAHGVREGWLPREEFASPVERGWQAIKTRVSDDGSLVDVCTGTGKMKSLREYLDRTAILDRDPRGGAMALLVATEMMQWPLISEN